MSSISDIFAVNVTPFCNECSPCKHDVQIIFRDRSESNKQLNGPEILEIIRQIPTQKFNVSDAYESQPSGWTLESAIRHFSDVVPSYKKTKKTAAEIISLFK